VNKIVDYVFSAVMLTDDAFVGCCCTQIVSLAGLCCISGKRDFQEIVRYHFILLFSRLK